VVADIDGRGVAMDLSMDGKWIVTINVQVRHFLQPHTQVKEKRTGGNEKESRKWTTPTKKKKAMSLCGSTKTLARFN